MPEIIKLLKKNENVNLLNNIFEYFEKVCNSTDKYLLNNFLSTVLETMGSYNELLVIARKYMVLKTLQLLIETMDSI